jgi:hypothetical protein
MVAAKVDDVALLTVSVDKVALPPTTELAVPVPADGHLVDLARLMSRYEGFPGADDLRDDLAKTLGLWALSRDELHGRTRAIWAGGYRPGAQPVAEAVGSGFDTADQDSP